MVEPIRDKLVWLVVGLCFGLAVGIGGMTLANKVKPAPIVISAPEPTLMPEPSPTPLPTATPGPIRVYVSGHVVSAAVYELPPDSIVDEAIAAAGGFAPEADQVALNLAQTLADGVQIYVPSLEETEVEPVRSVIIPPESKPLPSSSDVSSETVLNINQANGADLEKLPGIGPALAQRILDYRDAHGPFQQIDEILNVSGIGEAKFEAINELITTGMP